MTGEEKMELKNVTAIIPTFAFETVEKQLQKMGVRGLTVTKVRGYGEHKDFIRDNWLCSHVRIEIFTEKNRADEIATAIMETAHTGTCGDGIVCILPVEKVFRIRTKSEAKPDEI
jgi:nitrogen regulatory protein P-II 1